ncbi:response regulator [candidate division KSB1 bacterium]|nr:MAG: response regulator [candidate division KSB1 bacterium]
MAHILVIDDDETYRAILREFIEEKGHAVFEAESADQGVQIFLSEKIDLVISDLMMPVKSGMDLLRELRNVNSKVLFIMVTGFPTVSAATTAMREGAYDFLVKPMDMNQLNAVMTRALGTIELRSNLSTMRGMNVALLFSIPFWILAGILVRIFLLR